MKRTALQLVVVLAFVGSVRADQTIQSVQQALTDQGFYYGNVTGEKSAVITTRGLDWIRRPVYLASLDSGSRRAEISLASTSRRLGDMKAECGCTKNSNTE